VCVGTSVYNYVGIGSKRLKRETMRKRLVGVLCGPVCMLKDAKKLLCELSYNSYRRKEVAVCGNRRKRPVKRKAER